MSTAAVFNSLADVMGSALANAFPDTLTVKTATESAGAGGQKIRTGEANTYTGVPCIYELIEKYAWRKDEGDRNLSTQMYKVTMPTHSGATRMTLNPATQRLVIAARGDEPSFTLRIISVANDMGVIYTVIAAKEN